MTFVEFWFVSSMAVAARKRSTTLHLDKNPRKRAIVDDGSDILNQMQDGASPQRRAGELTGERLPLHSSHTPAAHAPQLTPPLTPTAFAARFQSVWQPLWCIAAAVVRDRNEADDIVQEAAVIALGKLNQFDPGTNFTAWMGKIVRFVALNHARRQHRNSGVEVDARMLEVTPDNAPQQSAMPLNGRGELTAGEAFDDRVLAALATLDETARACLLLRTLLNMPYRQIALALDIAEGTAMSHVHRARAALRERLSGFIAHPPELRHDAH